MYLWSLGFTSLKLGTGVSNSGKSGLMTSLRSCRCHWDFPKTLLMTKWKKWCSRWVSGATTVTSTSMNCFTDACVASTVPSNSTVRCRSTNWSVSTKSTTSLWNNKTCRSSKRSTNNSSPRWSAMASQSIPSWCRCTSISRLILGSTTHGRMRSVSDTTSSRRSFAISVFR